MASEKSPTEITLEKIREEWELPLRARIRELEGVLRCAGLLCMSDGCTELAVYISPRVCSRHISVVVPMPCSCPADECRGEGGPYHRCKLSNPRAGITP